ncbi:hypothetical protein J3A83DRAFT_1791160 [Scleroderma citrinum]
MKDHFSSSKVILDCTKMRHGIYIFINRQSGTAMDLISDDKLLVGMPPNDSDSQKWEVAPLGAGHTIRNVKTGKYLSVLHATRKEPIITTNFPVAWYMKKIYVVEENAAFFEIWWPNSRFMFEVVDSEHRAPWSRDQQKVICSDVDFGELFAVAYLQARERRTPTGLSYHSPFRWVARQSGHLHVLRLAQFGR